MGPRELSEVGGNAVSKAANSRRTPRESSGTKTKARRHCWLSGFRLHPIGTAGFEPADAEPGSELCFIWRTCQNQVSPVRELINARQRIPASPRLLRISCRV